LIKIYQRKRKKVEMKGFQRNEIKEDNKGLELGNKMDNVEHLSQKINNINNKNDEMGLMFIEGLSSLNSWKNDHLGNEIIKKTEWNLEKRENEENGLIYQYVYPNKKENSNISNTNNINNLSSSQESINSLTETEDGDDEKEKQIFSSYKLGICKIFENEKKIKSNIVKEINDKYYKIYSEGDPELIKTICKNDTIPENYDEIIAKNKEEGNEIMSLCGKKVKMNYLQCQKIERNKCESNMIFLGFVFYREIKGGYNPGYS
jgi:cation-transporting ATPase 13A3/4/5